MQYTRSTTDSKKGNIVWRSDTFLGLMGWPFGYLTGYSISRGGASFRRPFSMHTFCHGSSKFNIVRIQYSPGCDTIPPNKNHWTSISLFRMVKWWVSEVISILWIWKGLVRQASHSQSSGSLALAFLFSSLYHLEDRYDHELKTCDQFDRIVSGE